MLKYTDVQLEKKLEEVLYDKFSNIAKMINYSRGYHMKAYVTIDIHGNILIDMSEFGDNIWSDEILIATSFPANFIGDFVDDMRWDEEEQIDTNKDMTNLEILEEYGEIDSIYSDVVDIKYLKGFIKEHNITQFN